MIDRNRGPNGFTVVELIVAMSISAVTLLSGYELFTALKTAGDRQSEELSVTAGIVRGLDRMREDLLHAVARPDSKDAVFTGGNAVLDGRAETASLLLFYSLNTGYGAEWARGLRQTCRIRYELVPAQGSACLYRSVLPVLGAGPAHRTLVLDHVELIQLAFHNGQTRELAYTSKERLPVCVELVVKSHGRVWPLSIRLPCGDSEEQP
jgi:type II secretion system protein J